ncbi:serine/threonine protein kinase [Haloactinospora alba]|uniref:Serine/threonine protein kinase n=1 Tax=Haloactinospora alba TaxID=405555 RepID=A0A543NHG3_9ACTN|nr:serine/threonine-protein kinase [Haloactinospora alba]TQN31263.1 serine/threonine protein kinase [Haloactinospora alba]
MIRRSQREISVLVPPHLQHLADDDPYRVGPYLLIGRLGAGRTGTVYAAVNPAASDDSLVVVKTLRSPQLEDGNDSALLNQRLNALSTVDSRCYVPPIAFDAAPAGEPPWLCMTYVPGIALAQYVRRRGAMSPGRVMALAAGVAEGLASLHARGVAHGDLKPSNILLSTSGPRILDCALPGDEAVLQHSATWMSPQRHAGEGPSPAADVFGWGAVVAFAATGRLPFGMGEPDEMAQQMVSGGPDLDGVPEDLLPLVRRALATAPEERPSVRELIGSAIAAWERNTGPEDGAEEETSGSAVRGTAVTRLLSREWQGVVDPARLPRVVQLHNRPKQRRPARVPFVAGAIVLALTLVGGGAWAGINAIQGNDPLGGSSPTDSPSPSSPSSPKDSPGTTTVRFDPTKQENPVEGPWAYTRVEHTETQAPAPAQGNLNPRDWSAQWTAEDTGEPDTAVIAEDAEVLCAQFCKPGPGHIEDGRGTYEVTGQDFIDYLGWGQVVIAEVEFADEQQDKEGPQEIVRVTELFQQPLE